MSQTCDLAPKGFTTTKNLSGTKQCPPGQYSDGLGLCLNCLPGYYSSRPGSSECTSCPQPASISPFDSEDTCRCVQGQVKLSDASNTICKPCDKEKIRNCNEVDLVVQKIRLKNGYWRSSEIGFKIEECPETCMSVTGGFLNSSSDSLCKKGNMGPRCSVCELDHVRDHTGVCYPCTDGESRL